jgi:uncharacterized protein
MTAVILLSVAIVALVMLAMAVGTLFSNRCLRGSCGGPEVLSPDGQSLSCDTCPLRRKEQPSVRHDRDQDPAAERA